MQDSDWQLEPGSFSGITSYRWSTRLQSMLTVSPFIYLFIYLLWKSYSVACTWKLQWNLAFHFLLSKGQSLCLPHRITVHNFSVDPALLGKSIWDRISLFTYQWCGLRPSVLGQDRSETKKIGLGLADLVFCCETRSCHARHHNDLEGHNNFSSTIYSLSILCLEHHYCGDQQWRSLT